MCAATLCCCLECSQAERVLTAPMPHLLSTLPHVHGRPRTRASCAPPVFPRLPLPPLLLQVCTDPAMIVMQYYPHGSLYDLLHRHVAWRGVACWDADGGPAWGLGPWLGGGEGAWLGARPLQTRL